LRLFWCQSLKQRDAPVRPSWSLPEASPFRGREACCLVMFGNAPWPAGSSEGCLTFLDLAPRGATAAPRSSASWGACSRPHAAARTRRGGSWCLQLRSSLRMGGTTSKAAKVRRQAPKRTHSGRCGRRGDRDGALLFSLRFELRGRQSESSRLACQYFHLTI